MADAQPCLRQATEADAAFVARLEEVCMRGYAVALWGAWRPDPEPFAPERHGIVIYGGRDVGCIEVAYCPDHLWLDKLYLLPDHQRRGIGTVVLRRLMAEAQSHGLPLRLSVLTTNPAQAFYRREGMRERARDAERVVFETPPAAVVLNQGELLDG